ncbi:MAG: L,D-transpeptidase family protein [Candidatus Omnitrophica bacterium]|nr:L,D-transpeptidase family protein [Candidatus Omnitrophota bacterium]
MKKFLWLISTAVLVVILMLVSVLNFSKTKPKDSLSPLLLQAQELKTKGELLNAKAIYQKLISEFANSNQVGLWQKELEALNIKLLFSPIPTAGSIIYEIKPGDSLKKIAREFKTTVDLIKKANNLTSDKILPGKKIKVWNAPFSILIDKSQNTLILKTNDEIIKTYIVSTGVNNSTPVGKFKITQKLINPTWFKDGKAIPAGSPENILGSRWLGFDLPGYGIHGTTDPESLGKQVTQGCVRMSNHDVEELYLIVPEGTEVVIVD